MHTACPKCGHAPLPADQALPAACPACGVILAKVGQAPVRASVAVGRGDAVAQAGAVAVEPGLRARLFEVPERVDAFTFWPRAALWLAFAAWGLVLVAQDYRTGEFGSAFLHRPLLVFHEAGHVIFRLFGEWMMFAGGTLGQLLMPAILGGALLWKNRDPFGASIGLWFLGVSVLDVAPYVYDALDPQLMLLSGRTGEDGGHDWIYLLRSMGLLERAQSIGAMVHKVGAVLVLLALAWGAWVLKLQSTRIGEGFVPD